MQRRKLGMAVVWMVCLLGMVAVVWSRPPLGGSRDNSHPPLALAAEPAPQPQREAAVEASATPQDPIAAVQATVTPSAQPEDRALPTGQWVREFPPFKVTVTVEDGHRLRAAITGQIEELLSEYLVTADYHITKDSILYGVITSAEIRVTSDKPEVQMEVGSIASWFFDQPFAIRYRLDQDALTIKDLKIGHLPNHAELGEALAKFAVGRYHPANNAFPPTSEPTTPVFR